MRARSLLVPIAVSLVALAAAAGCGDAASAPPADGAASSGSGSGSGGMTLPDGGPVGAGSSSGTPSSSGGSGSGSGSSSGGGAHCAPSWTVTADCGGAIAGAANPDLGPDVLVFDPSMNDIQSKLDATYGQQDSAQFGDGRYAFLFKPGSYALDVKIGFYTEALGLGKSPDDVVITGAVRAKADWLGNNNATCNFWRGVENLAVTPSSDIDNGTDRWGISQGTHMRRVHVKGDLALDDGGWSSGGFLADALVDGTVSSGTQQQFLTRNVDMSWQGSNWNMVFLGDHGAPQASWPAPPYTVTDKTPRIREKPFLYLDDAGHYAVMVPSLVTDRQGYGWGDGAAPGLPRSIDHFHVAKPDADSAASLNAALAAGQDLLFTPGIYHLDAALHVTRPGTVVLGLGIATLVNDTSAAIFDVDDVDDVTLAGMLLDAGTGDAPTLLQVGPAGSSASHTALPTALFDVHCRIGGAHEGKAKSCTTVNSHDVIIDNTWLWRADHGDGDKTAGWTDNPSANGIIVNGDDVTAYGLFSEHFQEYQTLWNGNGGAVYFYQSEMPYDPPNQGSWMAASGHDGYPSYKVADGVTSHHAEGIGVYSVFQNDVTAANAIEFPAAAGVSMHHMMSVSLASGQISHIDNGQGGTVGNGNMTAFSGD